MRNQTITSEASGNAKAKVTLIPGDFPKDVYVAANPIDAWLSESSGKVNLTLLCAAYDADALVKSFQEGMAEQGWAVVASSKPPHGTITTSPKTDASPPSPSALFQTKICSESRSCCRAKSSFLLLILSTRSELPN